MAVLRANAKAVLQDASCLDNIRRFQEKSQAAGENAVIAEMIPERLRRIAKRGKS